MEAWFALLTGLFFAAGIYLILSSHIVRVLLGFVLFGNAVNLLLFTAGRITREIPPIIADGADTLAPTAANPLPQALILTAIVISFSFFTFLLVLATRAWRDLGAEDGEALRTAEPRDRPAPPMGY